ncbi:MAG: hypothetical protein ABEH90_03075 [Halolamina sp.]
MSDNGDELYDEGLPGEEPGEEGRLLKYILLGVVAILLYAAVTLFLAATNVGV